MHTHIRSSLKSGISWRPPPADAGINAVYIEIVNGSSRAQAVVEWTDDAACASSQLDIRSACETCRESSYATVSFIILSCITQLFQVTTDLQRSTR